MNPTQIESSRFPGVFWSALFAAALTASLSAVFYGGFHRLTHHRPLGAATLAVLVTATFVGVFAVSWRIGIGRKLALAMLTATTLGLAVAVLMT